MQTSSLYFIHKKEAFSNQIWNVKRVFSLPPIHKDLFSNELCTNLNFYRYKESKEEDGDIGDVVCKCVRPSTNFYLFQCVDHI
jgi:hypothetical protein